MGGVDALENKRPCEDIRYKQVMVFFGVAGPGYFLS